VEFLPPSFAKVSIIIEIATIMVGKFEEYLKKAELSANTIQSYLWTVRHFLTNSLSK